MGGFFGTGVGGAVSRGFSGDKTFKPGFWGFAAGVFRTGFWTLLLAAGFGFPAAFFRAGFTVFLGTGGFFAFFPLAFPTAFFFGFALAALTNNFP
ncbi:MAG: hypothetical protein KIT79_05650 [Deltaproteobacteria bacterium]|nr:hypothetical protein [Deltaproteobacteria bacterium]